jgi:hypothetical protein
LSGAVVAGVDSKQLQAIRTAVQGLRSDFKGPADAVRKLSKTRDAERALETETRDFWRALLKAIDPRSTTTVADRVAGLRGADIVTILACADARGVFGAQDYVRSILDSSGVGAQSGTGFDTSKFYARYRDLGLAYGNMVDAFEKAVDEPPYTRAKVQDAERACDRLERAAGETARLLPQGSPEAVQILRTKDDADQWRSTLRAAVPWVGSSQESTVQRQINELLRDSSMRDTMYQMPPRGWYDLAVLREQAESLFRQIGAGSGFRNWSHDTSEWMPAWMRGIVATATLGGVKVVEDDLARCYDRARYFALNSAVTDPFTNRRSNLPYEDFFAKSGASGKSVDWIVDEAKSNVGRSAEHHAARYVWQGGVRPGFPSKSFYFVVDTWRGGEYLVCTYEKWRRDNGPE